MYLVKTPFFIRKLFPNFHWKVPTKDKVIYLTFDDGPVPEVTPWVLAQLAAEKAKATFFCVGDNIRRYGKLFQQLVDEGHSVGNHTFHHLSGWATEDIPYFHDIRHCAKLMKSVLFRPPYGRLKPSQVQFLQRHYRIVMWDVLSGDFDAKISPDQCLDNVLRHAGAGSIVVFHDSLKAREKLMYVLPKVLKHFRAKGFRFEGLTEAALQGRVPSQRQLA